MAPPQRRKAIIIGAGLGGLTAAIGLRQQGIDAVVYEAAPDLRQIQVGGAIVVWTNAMKALRLMGLDQPIMEAGSPIEHQEFWTHTGKPMYQWKIGEIGRQYGAPSYAIMRSDLLQILTARLDDDALQLGKQCTGLSQDEHSVTARFTDGAEVKGDLLVGADGLLSTIRSLLWGKIDPLYQGYTAWSGYCTHEDVAPHTFFFYWGRGKRFFIFKIGKDKVFWLAIANAPEGGKNPESGAKPGILELFQGFAGPVEDLVRVSEESAIRRLDVFDRDPMVRWGVGRVTLLGDAAHPMTFNLGQGACQGTEDCAILARSLTDHQDIPTALREYEKIRTVRSAAFVKEARAIGRMGTLSNPVVCALRDRFLMLMLRGYTLRIFEKNMAYEF